MDRRSMPWRGLGITVPAPDDETLRSLYADPSYYEARSMGAAGQAGSGAFAR
jgi:hypothetical protein